MKLFAKFNAVFDRVIDFLALLAAILLALLMLIVCIDVVMRHFFLRPIMGVTEVSEILMVYIPFLGAIWVLKREGHVKIDMLLTWLNLKPRAMTNIITSILGAVTCLVIAWYSARATLSHAQMGYYLATMVNIPTAPVLAVIPVSSFLLFIQFLRRANGYKKDWGTSPQKPK